MRLLLCALLVMASGCQKSETAKHRDIANGLLTHRGTPDFADASTAEYAAIRHTPSGMLCVLPASGAVEFDVFPAESINAGGQCSSTEGDVVTAMVAVHFREATTLDAAFASAVGQLTSELQAQPWSGEPSAADRASPDGLTHYRIHRLESEFDGERRYLRIAMSEKDGWYLQQIVTAPIATADATEAAAGEAWRRALQEFARDR